MNQDQFLSWLRTTLGGAGALAVEHGLTTSSTATAVTGAVVALAPFIWGFFVHTDSAKLQAAGAVTGVNPIQVNAAGAPDLQKLAMDAAIKTVVVAPSVYTPTTTQRR